MSKRFDMVYYSEVVQKFGTKRTGEEWRKLEQPALKYPKLRGKTFEDVPTDCIALIIDYLGTGDWIRFSCTCKRVNEFKYHKPSMIKKCRSCSGRKFVKSFKDRETLFNVWFHHYCDDEMMKELSGVVHSLLLPSYKNAPTVDGFKYLQGTIHTLIVNSQPNFNKTSVGYIKDTLSALSVWNCSSFDDQCVEMLTKLDTLSMSCTMVTNEGLKSIGPRLKRLELYGSDITDDVFLHFKHIEYVKVHGCKNITADAFFHIKDTVKDIEMVNCRQVGNKDLKKLDGYKIRWNNSHCLGRSFTRSFTAFL